MLTKGYVSSMKNNILCVCIWFLLLLLTTTVIAIDRYIIIDIIIKAVLFITFLITTTKIAHTLVTTYYSLRKLVTTILTALHSCITLVEISIYLYVSFWNRVLFFFIPLIVLKKSHQVIRQTKECSAHWQTYTQSQTLSRLLCALISLFIKMYKGVSGELTISINLILAHTGDMICFLSIFHRRRETRINVPQMK